MQDSGLTMHDNVNYTLDNAWCGTFLQECVCVMEKAVGGGSDHRPF